MTTRFLPQAVAVARHLNDVQHRLAIVFIGEPAPVQDRPGVELLAGWAVALVASGDGSVLAWDGWYVNDAEDQKLPVDVLDGVDWDEWDDMPSKLLVNRTRPWLAGPVLEWLLPTFSVAREAASLFASHFDSDDSPESDRAFHGASVVAYLPLLDEDVLVQEVERLVSRFRNGDGGARAILADALRGLQSTD